VDKKPAHWVLPVRGKRTTRQSERGFQKKIFETFPRLKEHAWHRREVAIVRVNSKQTAGDWSRAIGFEPSGVDLDEPNERVIHPTR